MRDYYSAYAERGVVRTFYAVNVPFDAPALEFDRLFQPALQYKLLGGGATPAILFRPQEWRGEHCASKSIPNSKYSCPTAAEMATRLNNYPSGTVTQIYATSDGGFGISTLYTLVSLLAEHITIVNHNQLAEFAVRAEEERMKQK